MWHRVESLLEVFLVVVAEEVAVFGDEVRGVAKTSWWSWGGIDSQKTVRDVRPSRFCPWIQGPTVKGSQREGYR